LPRSILTAIATAAVGLGLSCAPALAEPVGKVPLVKTLDPVLCWYGSNSYSEFYALNITAPNHLPLTAVKGGYVFRCRVAMRVAALFTARYITVSKSASERGSLTFTVGGPHYKNLIAWRLGRTRCTYMVVHGAVDDHLAVRCRQGATLVTFSRPGGLLRR
jgi:hypothetical protein